MADKVVELRKTQEEVGAPPAVAAKPARFARAAAPRAAGRDPADRARRRLYFYLAVRPLHLDRQRLCRRAEGAHHAGHLRQDRQGHGDRGPARQRGRCADRDRSRAVPHRRDAGRSAACRRAHRLRQPEDQSRLDDAPHRAGARNARSQAARRRAQEHAARQSHRLAGRHGQRAQRGRDGEDAARTARAAAAKAIRNQLLGDPELADREISALRAGLPPRSTRPSAISTTPCCARRSPAWRRRSRASRWAATSRPARRCSA